MKSRRIWMAIGLMAGTVAAAQGQTAIGRWRDCFDYSNVEHVEVAGGRVYAAAPGGLFCYDTEDRTVTTLGKSKGLHDTGISALAYDGRTQCLVVAYTNGNVDLMQDDRVYNLSDIKRSDIPGDKSIYQVRFFDGSAYLATGFGIVVVDLGRREIKETYYVGYGGGRTPVYDLLFTSDSIYAATGEGLKRAATSEPHLGISDRWEADNRGGEYTVVMLAACAERVLAVGYDDDPESCTALALGNGGSTIWATGNIRSIRTEGGRVLLSTPEGVRVYDESLSITDSVNVYTWGRLDANDAVADPAGNLWVGHTWDGLVQVTGAGTSVLKPQGPASGDNVYRLVPTAKQMLLCPGGHTTTYANTYLSPNLFTTDGKNWWGLDNSDGLLNNTYDVVDAAVNPANPSETAIALWGSGVAIINDNRPKILYNQYNTDGALQPYTLTDYSTLLTSAVAYDNSGNLWVLNSHQPYALAVREQGKWRHVSTAALATVPEVDKLVCDSVTGYKWFCGRSNVIYVHDGTSRMAKVNPNNGSKLSTESVTALVQDQGGNLWVGTNKGIKVIYDGYRAFNNGGQGEYAPVICSNITITNGEFAEYLMAYESITAIAVDGANRKWVGTASGGLYLLSASGLEQLQHFTTTNSPLLSDKIVTLAVQPTTGEVYVGTDRGVQVYRSTATYADQTPEPDIHAFPNPVRPGYEGPIAIKGFTRNALVHITDAAGHVVYSTTAEGGQAIWYGRTHDGAPVASGVYYVFASDAEGNNRSVAKILIVR